jgi:predicted transcriptional regulator
VQKNILDFAIQDDDTELIKILLKEMNRIQSGKSKRPNLPSSSLSKLGTGVFNKYQFGFKTRAVNVTFKIVKTIIKNLNPHFNTII